MWTVPQGCYLDHGSRWRCERKQRDSATAHISSTGLVDEPIDWKPFGTPARKSPSCNDPVWPVGVHMMRYSHPAVRCLLGRYRAARIATCAQLGPTIQPP